jgi:crossover junction endodeoxyribonuclease RuvC
MKILGIDPGYDRLGLAVIEKPARGKETLLYSMCFETSSKDTIYERFKQIGSEMERVLDQFEPDVVALETLFISTNQKTGMRVSEARGIIIHEAVKRNLLIHEYSPGQIKMAVTGDGTSDKGHMYKMVHMLISIPKKKARDDEYDAIAVALTCAAHIRRP